MIRLCSAVQFDASTGLLLGVTAAAIRCRNCVAETNTCCRDKLPAAESSATSNAKSAASGNSYGIAEWLPQLRPRDRRLVEFVTLANSSRRLPPNCVSATAASARSVLVACGAVGVPRCGRSCLQQRSLINTRSSKNGYDHHSACHRRSCCLFFRRRPRRRSSTRALRMSSPMPLPSIAFSSEPPPLRDKAAAQTSLMELNSD